MNAVIAQIAAIATTIGFLGLMCFQILLALGFPFGQVAWGGKYIKLPPGLRIASIFSVAIYVLASILVLERAAIVSVINKSTVVTTGVWILVAFLALNTLSNLASRSKLEKLIMTPVSVTLGLLCLAVAISSS
ncbi:MAG: hypothetical protein ISS58_08680 [Dehalococcoidales bacterium]|nr:hypothetical protein [Dehalococcoidales bacterium]